MKIKTLLLSVFLLTSFIQVDIMSGQQGSTQAKPDSVAMQPYASTGITEAFGITSNLIAHAGSKMLSVEQSEIFRAEQDTLFSMIDGFLGDSTVISLEGISIRELDDIGQRAGIYINELNSLEKRLSDRANEVEETVVQLSRNMQRWQLSIETISEELIPQERRERIDRILLQLDSMRVILQKNIGDILVIQDRLADKSVGLADLQTRVRDQKTLEGESLTTRDMPGFFRDLSSLKDSTLVPAHVDQFKESIKEDIGMLKKEYTGDMVTVLVFFILFLIGAIWYKRNFDAMMDLDRFTLTEIHLAFVRAPGLTVVFLITLLVRFLIPDLPRTFFALNLVIMTIPLALMVIRLFGRNLRTWIILLVTVYCLIFLYELAYRPDILLRIFLMLFTLTAIGLYIWVYLNNPFQGKFSSKFIARLFRLLIRIFMVFLLIALIANFLGAFRLAEFFTLLPVHITMLAIAIQVASKLTDTLIFLFLSSNFAQKAHVIREEFDVVYKKTGRLFDLLLWIFFVVAALNIFRLKEVVFEWGRGFLTNGLKLGEVNISLGNILIFIFVIWLSILITRIINKVLEQDVFARVKVAKGIPSTVVLLVRIVLITGGFFLAAKAAGMALTNLSIVLGAFSVGIGFGLQNIFNNMVSGLILAFERPIKVGDVVQVGELMGTVQSIGLRSSNVKSFDGAEVIVPNGNLISNEMINWTLSDSNRRMDIRVGVAYGTDPELVLGIMEKIAEEHKEVRKIPQPTAYFIEFGDSSLNFRLLAWVNLDNRLGVESEINVLINRRLAEAGIEIPFPQTDLHIRSDDTKPRPKKD